MGTHHLDDKAIAMNVARKIMDECAALAKNPQYKGTIAQSLNKYNASSSSFSDFALDNIMGIYEYMMYADRNPYPQAVEMYNRLHFLKDGEILPDHKGKRRFKDTVRAGEIRARADRGEQETAVVNKDFEQRKIDGSKLVPKFFEIVVEACGKDSPEVKNMVERWLTLNYMFRQPNVSGRENDDSAYKRAWFQTAGAFQNRIKELNRDIVKKIQDDFRAELKAKRKQDGNPSLPGERRKIGVSAAPRPLGTNVVPFNQQAKKKKKNMPVPKPDEKLFREKIIKLKSYGVMRSKLRSEMTRIGDAYEIAKQAQIDEKRSKNAAQGVSADADDILPHLVGLKQVKNELRALRASALRQQINKKFFPDKYQDKDVAYHAIFYGNPGTAKTTVAEEELASFYKSIGVLPEGHVVKVKRQDLVGEHIGKTATKTQAVIDRAIGGLLFIDEAYTLYSISENDYGQEALDTIMTAMDEERDRLVVVLAGYPEEMKKLQKMNPGLLSRVNTYLTFDDYTNEELGDILDLKMDEIHLEFTDNAIKQELVAGFEEARQKLGRNFGNGRFVRNVVQKMEQHQAHRLHDNDLISEELLALDANDPSVVTKLQDELFHITRDDALSALQTVMNAAMGAMETEVKNPIGFRIHSEEPTAAIG